MFNKGKNGTVTEGQIMDILKRVQDPDLHKEIGRASCRERVCQYV